MWDGRQLRAVSRGIVVKLKEWDREEFHVFRDSEDFSFRHLHQEQLLALLRFSDVCGYERVHERFKVGPPPLGEAVPDLPLIVDAMRDAELLRVSRWRKAIVEPPFKTVDLVFTGFEVVTG